MVCIQGRYVSEFYDCQRSVKISGYFEIGFCDNMLLNHGVEWEGFCAFQYALIEIFRIKPML